MVEANPNQEAPLSSNIVIFVCGTTGVGKSKFALDLAQHTTLFGENHGEIINADSM